MKAILFVGVLLLAGCRTTAPLPPIDLSSGEWTTQTGMAVWTQKRNTTDIAGELLVARNPSGRTVVEFTKTPFPFVVAQTTTNTWQVEFPAMNKRYSGRGTPPRQLGWLFLGNALQGKTPPKPWSFTSIQGSDNWRLENPRTGEVIEGFLNP